jgi:TPP-dependent pyruvate/acetoin dehydrogenase alpha subunit
MLSDAALYKQMLRIRRFEETVFEQFSSGVFFGTTHSCIGQEANAVGVIANINNDDIVVSNHRSHGHFIAYGGDTRSLFAELMGKSTGVVAGRGGSQHLCWKNFYSNGIQGGITPVATGMALAEKYKGNNVIVIVFIGDGTLGEGVVYETLNMASLWNAPILFVLENNHIAQTTPIEQAVAGNIALRFESYGITTEEIDTSDVKKIYAVANAQVSRVRSKNSPSVLIIHTCRFGPHSKGDDTRDKSEILNMRRTRDPVVIQGDRLDNNLRESINVEINKEIQQSFNQALNDPYPNPEDVFIKKNIYNAGY